jgi:hypothetical protein
MVVEHYNRLVPDPNGGAGAMRPLNEVIHRPCGVRYQEVVGGGINQICACGTFAIGVCAKCGKLVCGDHSSTLGGRRLCATDARATKQEDELATAEARLTREKFLDIAAASGNPGLRNWIINRIGLVQHRAKIGLFRTHTWEAPGTVGEYSICGWLLPGNGGDSCSTILTDDGRIHRASWSTPGPRGDCAKWHNWGDTVRVPETEIGFDWGTQHRAAADIDTTLRMLCAQLGLPL